jgi:hypothetical protein
LFQSHNTYLNDVKDRAVSDVTQRNGAIQGGVKRQATLERHHVGYAAVANDGTPRNPRIGYGEDQRGTNPAWWLMAVARAVGAQTRRLA